MKIPEKFPTVIGLFLLILIVISLVFVEKMFRAPIGASGSQEPSNIHFSNITDTSFTTSWTTQLPASATLLVSSKIKNSKIYYDDRDISGKIGKYTTHSITIRDAQPDTDYTIKLLSNGSQYLNNGKPYAIKTPSKIPANTSGLEPAYGNIYQDNGIGANGALVYISIEGGQELSTITKPSGLWLIPLNQVRTLDLTSFLPTVERMNETILIRTEKLESTALTDTLNDSPVPDITMGKTYDFRRLQAKTTSNAPLALRPTPTAALPIGGAVLGDTSTQKYSVTLTNPASEASLTTTLPLIQGTGVPNKFIGISVGITQPFNGSAKVLPNGTWSFTPPKPLAPGRQSVTISSVDSAGKSIAITHMFTILKSGTQVLGDATPSATLTITPTATPLSLEVPISTLSAEPPPTSGNGLPTILLLLLGTGLFAGGAVEFRLKRFMHLFPTFNRN